MRTAVRAIAPVAPVAVTCIIHAANIMEWAHVLISGVTNELLLYLSQDTAALAEERNLLYVAITRAQQTLRLYHAPAWHARSRQRFAKLSRFIDSPSVGGLMTEIRRKKR